MDATGVITKHATEVQWSWVAGSGPNVIWGALSFGQVIENDARLYSASRFQCQFATICSDISRSPCTTAALQHCPARPVPPPRLKQRRSMSAADRHRRQHVIGRSGNDHSDGWLTVIGGVGRIERASSIIEARLAHKSAMQGRL